MVKWINFLLQDVSVKANSICAESDSVSGMGNDERPATDPGKVY